MLSPKHNRATFINVSVYEDETVSGSSLRKREKETYGRKVIQDIALKGMSISRGTFRCFRLTSVLSVNDKYPATDMIKQQIKLNNVDT